MWFLLPEVLVVALVPSLLILGLAAHASAQDVQVPTLTRYVSDLTGTLEPAQVQSLEARLKAFEDSTSNQIAVVMMSTIGSESMEDLTLRIAESNKIGVRNRNNGILLFIARDDHRMRIEVGYGLEGALPDALSGQIIRREIAPRFKQGDYFGGISAGVDAIMLATKGEYKADKKRRDGSSAGWFPLLIVLVIVIIVLRTAFRSRRRSFGGFGPTMWGGPLSGGGWGGGSGGGGFGGGGFSGGGGSFGGGGASGGW